MAGAQGAVVWLRQTRHLRATGTRPTGGQQRPGKMTTTTTTAATAVGQGNSLTSTTATTTTTKTTMTTATTTTAWEAMGAAAAVAVLQPRQAPPAVLQPRPGAAREPPARSGPAADGARARRGWRRHRSLRRTRRANPRTRRWPWPGRRCGRPHTRTRQQTWRLVFSATATRTGGPTPRSSHRTRMPPSLPGPLHRRPISRLPWPAFTSLCRTTTRFTARPTPTAGKTRSGTTSHSTRALCASHGPATSPARVPFGPSTRSTPTSSRPTARTPAGRAAATKSRHPRPRSRPRPTARKRSGAPNSNLPRVAQREYPSATTTMTGSLDVFWCVWLCA
eukprot:m.174248 g.174248  ORF g.174248 m.174248 type:complete len:335 (+) comp17891_c1_seq1:849-1853(+)